MSDKDPVVSHLIRLRSELGLLRLDCNEARQRLSSLESKIAVLSHHVVTLHGDFAGQSGRLDRIEAALCRLAGPDPGERPIRARRANDKVRRRQLTE